MQRALEGYFQQAFSVRWIGFQYWMCSPAGCSALCSGFRANKFDQTRVQRGMAAGRVPVSVQQA